MLGNLKGWHILVLLVVILLLFGAPKLPEFARNLGKSLNILKEETQNLRSDTTKTDAESTDTAVDTTAKKEPESRKEAVLGVVRQTFKPEFLNRLDEVVIFDPLSTEDLTQIVELQVHALANRLRDRRITLDVTDAAKEWLALTGYDPSYGARPLRRLVQKEIGDRLAKALLSGDVRDGGTVKVDLDAEADTLVLRWGLGADMRRRTGSGSA